MQRRPDELLKAVKGDADFGVFAAQPEEGELALSQRPTDGRLRTSELGGYLCNRQQIHRVPRVLSHAQRLSRLIRRIGSAYSSVLPAAYISAVARSIWEARREAAAKLDNQLRENADQIIDDHPYWAKVADPWALRGIPAVSKHAAGSALDGVPGSDAHLARMDGE
jgi:hypothetical protein